MTTTVHTFTTHAHGILSLYLHAGSLGTHWSVHLHLHRDMWD